MKTSTSGRFLLTVGLLGVGACRGMTDEGSGGHRITLDLRSLVGGIAAPPDFVSVLDTARLRITAGGLDSTQALSLGQSDSTAAFDVAVQSDSARFRLDVFSNNLTLLYRADTTVPIVDNFAVQITPQPVNAVMVIWPRHPPYDTTDSAGDIFFIEARWQIRNAGPAPLLWRVDTLGTDYVLSCFVFPRQKPCLTQDTLLPSDLPDTVAVFFGIPDTAVGRTVTFTSNVGQATFETGIP